jgi:hypothetical protein
MNKQRAHHETIKCLGHVFPRPAGQYVTDSALADAEFTGEFELSDASSVSRTNGDDLGCRQSGVGNIFPASQVLGVLPSLSECVPGVLKDSAEPEVATSGMENTVQFVHAFLIIANAIPNVARVQHPQSVWNWAGDEFVGKAMCPDARALALQERKLESAVSSVANGSAPKPTPACFLDILPESLLGVSACIIAWHHNLQCCGVAGRGVSGAAVPLLYQNRPVCYSNGGL